MQYPLKNGTFEVIQSGRFWNIHESESEKYAMDITKVSSLKSWFQFRKSDLESDSSYQVPVYSPCLGIVRKVTDGFGDMPIGIVGKPTEANAVIIGCDGFNVSLVHFKRGSIVVEEGDTVNIGQEIAEVGNSGYSFGPHLHIAAYKTDSLTGKTVNVPITFDGRYFYRGDSFTN